MGALYVERHWERSFAGSAVWLLLQAGLYGFTLRRYTQNIKCKQNNSLVSLAGGEVRGKGNREITLTLTLTLNLTLTVLYTLKKGKE